VIRAVLHLLNDQPLTVELDEPPTAGDVSVVCRNARTLDGKRPVFIEQAESTFLFPISQIRFLEILRPAEERGEQAQPAPAAEAAEPDELEIDEDFLRRVREA
jgi:hypothetical protein